jgi:hypothetical protein
MSEESEPTILVILHFAQKDKDGWLAHPMQPTFATTLRLSGLKGGVPAFPGNNRV